MEVVTKGKFADSIYSSVNKVNKENDYQLFNSVIIAQSVLETGWGQSKIMMKANALFGIKAGSGWKGKVYSSYTNEVYDGVECTEYATFRAYDNIEDSIEDYYKLIKNNYKKALNCNTQKESIQAIKNGGYATDPDYVSKIMSIINSNDFIEKYDNINYIEFTPGHYIVNTDVLTVRSTPKIEENNWFRYSQLTSNAQKQVYEKSGYKPNGLVKGVECDVSETTKADGYTWGKIPSGWIALEYCKKG